MAEQRPSPVVSDSSCLAQDTSALPIQEANEELSKGKKTKSNGKKDVRKKTLRDLKMEPNTPDAAPFVDEKKGVGVRSNEAEMKEGPSVYSQVMAHLSKDHYSTPVRCVTPERHRPGAKPKKRPARKEKKVPPPVKTRELADDAAEGKFDDSWMGKDERDIGSLEAWLSRAEVKLDGATMRDLLIVWQRAQQYQARNHAKEYTAEKGERGKEQASVSSEAKALESKLDSLVEQVELVREEIRGGDSAASTLPKEVLDRFKNMEMMVSKTRRDIKLIGVKALASQTERLEASSRGLKEAVKDLTGDRCGCPSPQQVQGLLKEALVGPLMTELTKRWKGEFAMLREDVRALRRDNKKIRDEIRSLDFAPPEVPEPAPPPVDLEGEIKEMKSVLIEMQKSLDKALAPRFEHRPAGESGPILNQKSDWCPHDGEQKDVEQGQAHSTIGVVEIAEDLEGSTGSVNDGGQQEDSTPEVSDGEIVPGCGNETPRGTVLFKNDLFNDPIPERTVIRLRADQIQEPDEVPVETGEPVFGPPGEKASFLASLGWVDRQHGSRKRNNVKEESERMANMVSEIVKEVEAGERNGVEHAENVDQKSANEEITHSCIQDEEPVDVDQRVQEESSKKAVSGEVVPTASADGCSQHVQGSKGIGERGGVSGGNQQPMGLFGKCVTGPDGGVVHGEESSSGKPPVHGPPDAGEVNWPVDNGCTKPQGSEVAWGSSQNMFGEAAKQNPGSILSQNMMKQINGEVFAGVDQSMASQGGEVVEMSSLERGLFDRGGGSGHIVGFEQGMCGRVGGDDQIYDNEEDMVDQAGLEVQVPNPQGDIFGQAGTEHQVASAGLGMFNQMGNTDQISNSGLGMFNQMGNENQRDDSGLGGFNQMGNGDQLLDSSQDIFAQVGKEEQISTFGQGFFCQANTEVENTIFGESALAPDDAGDQSSNPEEDIFAQVGKDAPRAVDFGQTDIFDQFGEEDDQNSNFGQNMFGLGRKGEGCLDFEGMNGFAQSSGKENQFSVRESTDAMLCDEDTNWPDWGFGGNRGPLQNAENAQNSNSDGGPDVDDMVEMEEVKFGDKNGEKNAVQDPMVSRIPTLRSRATEGEFPRHQSKLRPPKKTMFDFDDGIPRTP